MVIDTLNWGDKISQYPKLKAWTMIVIQYVRRCVIDLASPHHKPLVKHPKILVGIPNPVIAKDVQSKLL
jgi:hypothetical protein